MPISLNYIIRRVFLSLFVILGVVLVTYFIIILSPGDPAVKWAGNPRGPNATLAIERARVELGLDKPIHIQIIGFIYNVLTGNLGESIAFKIPVISIIQRNLIATLELLIFTYAISLPIGISLGIYSALKRGTWIDGFLQTLGIVLANTPTFWIGTILFLLLISMGFSPHGRVNLKLAIDTGFTPITGFYLIDSLVQGNLQVFYDVFLRMIPPAVAISVYPVGLMIRVVRTLTTEILLEDYVRASIAWGVNKNIIIRHYVTKALMPGVIQICGLAFAYSLIDAMVIETAIYGREGLGTLLITSLQYSDFRLAIALIIVVTVFYLVVNTIADLIQAIIDPRVKL
ncbi:MAG: ABC transporter permease [Desulfurococcaceae archaeon]